MNLFYQPLISEGVLTLDAAESRHLIKVLRRKNGDMIHVTDGKGYLYHARITDADLSQCGFEILEKKGALHREYHIHIAISPLKNPDRLEWFLEKSIELGIDEITLLLCDHTEKLHLKSDRLEKVAISAMKQSLTLTLPQLHGPVPFEEFINHTSATSRFIAHVDRDNQQHLQTLARPNSNYLVLIGPEGDFSDREVSLAFQHDFKKVSLGSSRLRTETAGLAACHILNLVNSS